MGRRISKEQVSTLFKKTEKLQDQRLYHCAEQLSGVFALNFQWRMDCCRFPKRFKTGCSHFPGGEIPGENLKRLGP